MKHLRNFFSAGAVCLYVSSTKERAGATPHIASINQGLKLLTETLLLAGRGGFTFRVVEHPPLVLEEEILIFPTVSGNSFVCRRLGS